VNDLSCKQHVPRRVPVFPRWVVFSPYKFVIVSLNIYEPLGEDIRMARVLVVDDDEGIRGIVSRMLSRQHVVDTAENGAIALDMLAESTFDLVISDVQMPVMDGEALLLHMHTRGEQTPVLLMSGHLIDSDQVCLLAADFLAKPFMMGELVEKVEVLLSKHLVA
jgi:two-component system, cell cycle response regulator CpdR